MIQPDSIAPLRINAKLQAHLYRCGLPYVMVEASSGAMGGSESNEFVAKTPAGRPGGHLRELRLCGEPRKSYFAASGHER